MTRLISNLVKVMSLVLVVSMFGCTDQLKQCQQDLAAAQERERDELFAQIGRLTTQLAWLKKKSGLEPPEK